MKISLTQVYALLFVLVAYVSHVTSQTIPPVYNIDQIPLTANSFLDASAGRRAVYRGWAKTINGYTLSYNQQCVITVTNPSGTVLWKNINYIPTYCQPSALLILGADGNLCTSGSEVVEPFWCTATNLMGGKYLNFLPPNSYGREIAVVIQTSTGRMIWGAFGDITHPDAAYMLIPGNYIDVQNPLLNKLTNAPYLTNGRDQFCLGSDSKLRYFVGNPNNAGTEGSPIVWQSTNTALAASPNFYFSLYPADGKACVRSSANPTVDIWCMVIPTGVRYFKLPILDGSGFHPTPSNRDRWGFVFQGDGNFFFGGQFNPIQPAISYIQDPKILWEYGGDKTCLKEEYNTFEFCWDRTSTTGHAGRYYANNLKTGQQVIFSTTFHLDVMNFTVIPEEWFNFQPAWRAGNYILQDWYNTPYATVRIDISHIKIKYTGIESNTNQLVVISFLPEVLLLNNKGQVLYNYRV